MNSTSRHTFIRQPIWLAIILPIWLALIPLKVSAEGARVDGAQTTIDVTVNTVGSGTVVWNTLLSVGITIPAFQIWHCVATGSSEAINPGNVDNQYRFTLTLDDTSPTTNGGCERTIDIDDNAGIDDATNIVVGSTCSFLNVAPGFHTIRWLATKVAAGDANLRVEDSSATVVCTDILL
jgi:hypothetical protein